MSSKDALVIADRLQAALDNWVTKKRGLVNTVGDQKLKAPGEEANVTEDGPAIVELDGKTHTIPWAVVNKLIAQCAQRGISGASGSSATGSAGNGAGRNSAQRAANNSDQRGVCFKFRDTGTCSRGEQCRFVHNTPDSNSALTSGSGSDTAQRRVKHDFAQAGPCPSGAACSKHPFLESWTFGKNPNGDIVALSPKKGPFCQHNHSKEADGELTEDQLSKKKMISEQRI